MDEAKMKRVMTYCREEDLSEDDRALLASMRSAAEAYLLGAGVPEPDSGDPRSEQYEILANALTLDDWDNRGSQTAGYTISENPSFRRKLNQLKQTVPILGT